MSETNPFAGPSGEAVQDPNERLTARLIRAPQGKANVDSVTTVDSHLTAAVEGSAATDGGAPNTQSTSKPSAPDTVDLGDFAVGGISAAGAPAAVNPVPTDAIAAPSPSASHLGPNQPVAGFGATEAILPGGVDLGRPGTEGTTPAGPTPSISQRLAEGLARELAVPDPQPQDDTEATASAVAAPADPADLADPVDALVFTPPNASLAGLETGYGAAAAVARSWPPYGSTLGQ